MVWAFVWMVYAGAQDLVVMDDTGNAVEEMREEVRDLELEVDALLELLQEPAPEPTEPLDCEIEEATEEAAPEEELVSEPEEVEPS